MARKNQKNLWKIIGIIVLVLIIAIGLFFIIKNSGTTPLAHTSKFENMYYLVSPCNQEDKGVFANITIEENKVILHQKVSYVCCANITLSYEVYDGILVINEDNKGEICKCICNYEIFAQINESGITEVKVYGIFYPDVHPYDLLGESSVENQTLANPASVFCEEQGGTLEIRENTEGQYGVCIFSSGKECEEWAFFRGECSAS